MLPPVSASAWCPPLFLLCCCHYFVDSVSVLPLFLLVLLSCVCLCFLFAPLTTSGVLGSARVDAEEKRK